MVNLDYDKILEGIRKALYGYEVREYLAQSMEWTKAFVTQSVEQIKDYLRQAEAARDAAKTSENAAKTSETNAKASENAAASSASAAAGSASAAKTSENAAKTSETNAKTSETNAKASENETRQLVEAAKKAVNTDKTLTIDGAPADAKTVGDKFKSIKTDWNSVTDKPSTFPSTWDSVSGKPSSYPPSAHTHSYITNGGKATAITGAIGTPGLSLQQAYDNGYPTTYGNVLSIGGTGDCQILAGWSGNNNGIERLYYRNRRDMCDTWSDWRAVAFTTDITAASGVQSSGSNYVRFGDGTQICWGSIGSKSFEVTGNVHYRSGYKDNDQNQPVYSDVTKTASYSAAAIIFPQPFANGNYSLALQTSYGVSDASVFNGNSYTWEETKYYPIVNKPYTVTYTGNFTSISSTSPAMGRQATYCTLGNGAWGNYIAIGRWK